MVHRGQRHPGAPRRGAHRAPRPDHRVAERAPGLTRHEPGHAGHQRDRRGAAQRRRLDAADDRQTQPPPPGPGDRLVRCSGPGDVRRVRGRQLADRPAGAVLVPLLRCLRLLAGLDGPADHHWHLGASGGAHRDAAGGAHRHPNAGQCDRHAGPRPHADDADLRLPAADRAVLRHRGQCCGRLHPHLRPAADHPDRRLRHPRGLEDDHRGDRLGRPDLLAAVDQGAAPDGPQDDHRRAQPDDAGGALDGHIGRVRQRARPRRARARRTADQRRRHGLRARRPHRGHGRHAGPDHDRGQRAGREGGSRWRRQPQDAGAPS